MEELLPGAERLRIHAIQSLGQIDAEYAAARGKKLWKVSVSPAAFGNHMSQGLPEREDDILLPDRVFGPAEDDTGQRVFFLAQSDDLKGIELFRLGPCEKCGPARIAGRYGKSVRPERGSRIIARADSAAGLRSR